MPRLADWIENNAGGEAVESIVIGQDTRETPDNTLPSGVLLTWNEALPHLQYEFHDGIEHGGCHAFVAWTKSWVISVIRSGEYVAPFRVPRIPSAYSPSVPG